MVLPMCVQTLLGNKKRFMFLLITPPPNAVPPTDPQVKLQVEGSFDQACLAQVTATAKDRLWAIHPGTGPLLIVAPLDLLHIAKANLLPALQRYLAVAHQQVRGDTHAWPCIFPCLDH